MAKRNGMVLRWQRELIARFADEKPGNQTRIVAVAAALVTHADADGRHCRPGMRLLAAETGQHFGRVAEAIDWLLGDGWLILARTVAHGGREFTLTVPQRSGEGNATDTQRSGEGNAATDPERATLEGQRSGEGNARASSVRSASGQRSGEGNEPPYLRTSKNSSSDEYVGELVDAVLDRREAAGETFRNRPALKRKIVREDRDQLLAEDAELRALAVSTAALDQCSHCDHAGLRWSLPDGTPATRSTPDARGEKCDHADAGDVVPIEAAAR